MENRPQPSEIGRLMGKTGAGIALLALSFLAPFISAHVPMLAGLLDGAGPWLQSLGASMAGVGVIDKLRKLAVLFSASVERLPRDP